MFDEDTFDCLFNWWSGFAGKETCEAGYLICKGEECSMYTKLKEDKTSDRCKTEC